LSKEEVLKVIKGKVWKFGSDVDTDQIIPSQYLLLPTIDEMKQYTFEPLDKDFATKVRSGDIIIGGENFGSGSSREQAPRVLKALGISAVVAKSFARIFFRNSINIGLPVLICQEIYGQVDNGDTLQIDVQAGTIENVTNGAKYHSTKLPDHVMRILESNGLIEYLNNR
jgi:3-isopropylmalate/(R)-2-methylmalate dehydratase small subunit